MRNEEREKEVRHSAFNKDDMKQTKRTQQLISRYKHKQLAMLTSKGIMSFFHPVVIYMMCAVNQTMING